MNDRTYRCTEMCPHCQREIELTWNTDTDGYIIYCPSCGRKIFLCDECQHSEDNLYRKCDWHDGICFRGDANGE